MNETAAAATNSTAASTVRVGFWEALRFWLKLGFISFGGPAGQIAIMHSELLTLGLGWDHTLTQMEWFFTKAALVTWFTFLPSFIFILAGGPLVESTHGDLKFTAPLTAITATVVGVILNLALFFGYHVLWPQGFAGSFDWGSALIALGAAVALFKFKRNVIHVIAGCAAAGLMLKLVVL